MTSLADNEQAKEETKRVLTNWGRWCRDDWWKHLGYTKQPVTSRYKPPRQEDRTRVPASIDVDDAWLANEAINALYNENIEEYWTLVCWYPYGKTPDGVAETLGFSRRTAFRRWNSGLQSFFDLYQQIRRQNRKKAK